MFNADNVIDFTQPYHQRRGYIDRIADDNHLTLIGEGKHRRVFKTRSNKFVIKFPMNSNGLKANQYEADNYKLYRSEPNEIGIVYAPCRLIKQSALLMMVMEYEFGFDEGLLFANKVNVNIPKWAYSIDCHQVGMISSGKIVAYDSYEGR